MSCPRVHRFLLFVVSTLGALLCLAALSAASSSPYVFNRADFPSGNRPTGIVFGDFNGDGRWDLVVASQGDNAVAVFLGQSNGTLGPNSDFATGTSPSAVAVGDFNSDGKLDVAAVGSCGPTCGFVSILRGNGDGTFEAHVDYATGIAPLGLVVGDFNRDGVPDLAVVDSCGPTCGFVSILLGKGDGSFLAKTDYSVGQSPSAVATQDFNGDGKLDLVVTNSSDSVSVLLGIGDGTFRAHVDFGSNSAPGGVAAGDFNGDQVPDLVLTHSGAPWNVTIMKGNGDGTFQPEQQLATNLATGQVAVVDLNGDGKLDLVLTVVSQGGVGVFLGRGDGTFQPEVNYTTGVYPLAFTAQDMNGDGNLDLVVADQESNYVSVLLGKGDGTFSPRTNLPAGPSSPVQLYATAAVVGDFDGDGIPDLAVDEVDFDYPGTGVVSVLLGKGKGVFQSPVSTKSNGAMDIMEAGDFNGDGRLDIALSTGNGAAVMLGNSDGTFGSPLQVVNTLGTPARGLVTGDFNNDGNQDLVVLANGFVQANPIYVLLGNGDASFQPARQFWGSTSLPMAIAAADFNHDGKLDLVVNLNPNGIAVMLGNGDGTFQSAVTYPTDQLPSGLTVADLNGDGIPDVIATGDKVDVFLGKGDGTFPKRVDYNGGNFPVQVITGDFNADGKLDIAAAAEGTAAIGALEILPGNGDGTFQPPVEIADGTTVAGPMAVGDLNQDGTTDVFVSGNPGSVFFSGPVATLSAVSINFGAVGIGTTSPAESLILTNSGNAPLELAGITATAGYAVAETFGDSIAVSSSCTGKVTFSPAGLGSSTGVLTITDNAPRGRQSVTLFGSGQADFSLVVSPGSSNSLTVSAGSSATYDLIATPVAGFAQSVSFSCTGAPPAATCALSPSSVTLDGTHAATIAVQISTTGRTTAMNTPLSPVPEKARHLLISWAAIFLAPGAFLLLSRPRTARDPFVRVITCILGLGILLALTACGGSGGGVSGGGRSTGTPAGTYSLRVTALPGSGSVSAQHSVQVTLIVN